MSAVSLPPDVYYRLRFLQAQEEIAALTAQTTALRAEVEAARFRAALAQAGRDFSFDPTCEFTWHDATTSLVPATKGSPA